MSLVRSFPEADAAHIEIAHVTALTATFEAASYNTAFELRRATGTQ
jgi:hypothetical protein